MISTALKWRFLVLLVGTVPAGAQTSTAIRFIATTKNVSGAAEPVRFDISSWSTDAQKDEMVKAWTLANARRAEAAGAAGRGEPSARGTGARGASGPDAAGARDAAPLAGVPVDTDALDTDNPSRFGRGGRVEAAPTSPQDSLAAALKKAPTIGVLWTSETVGYSIKYAYREQQPDGAERIILATARRVGAWSNLWKPTATASAPSMDYPFSIIELRLNPKGEGEGRGAVFGKVTIDVQSKTIALDGYSALPVVFQSVRRQTAG